MFLASVDTQITLVWTLSLAVGHGRLDVEQGNTMENWCYKLPDTSLLSRRGIVKAS